MKPQAEVKPLLTIMYGHGPDITCTRCGKPATYYGSFMDASDRTKTGNRYCRTCAFAMDAAGETRGFSTPPPPSGRIQNDNLEPFRDGLPRYPRIRDLGSTPTPLWGVWDCLPICSRPRNATADSFQHPQHHTAVQYVGQRTTTIPTGRGAAMTTDEDER